MARKIKNLSPSDKDFQKLMLYSVDDDTWPKFFLIVFSIIEK